MSKRMKIYEIGTGYTPIPAQISAATEIVVEELTKAFMKQGVPVEILDIACKNRAENALPIREVPVPKCFSGTDVKLGIQHKLKRVVYSVALARTLKKLLKQTPERVVLHFHNQYNLFFFLKLTPEKLRRRCLVAYTNHSYIWHGDWDSIKNTIGKRYFQEVFAMQHADVVFVLNEHTRENILTHCNVPGERIRMINNGVNTETYAPGTPKMDELHGKHVYLQVGSVCDRKNQLEALRLLLPILRKDPSAMFIYAGGIIDPEYQKSVLQFALDNGVAEQVRYLGEIKPGEQLNAVYNSAKALIVPSKAEGFSLVIVEAMSAGLPVVVPETLQFRLINQCLRYKDDVAFFDIVHGKIENEERRMQIVAQGRQAVQERYSWEAVAQDYIYGFEKE